MLASPSERRASLSSQIGIVILLCTAACDGEKPAEWIGVCEQLYTSFDVIDGDRSASIAAVETTTPCMVSPGSCIARTSTDAGAVTACQRVNVFARGTGTCTLTVTSVSGQKVTAQIR
jgi:hypothetical protein